MPTLMFQILHPEGLLSPKSYVDVPDRPWKSDFLYTNFLPNFPPISLPFSKEKHPILTKLSAFYNNLPKKHPIYVIWAHIWLWSKPPIAIPNFAKKRPKRQAHIQLYVYHVNVINPSPGILHKPTTWAAVAPSHSSLAFILRWPWHE